MSVTVKHPLVETLARQLFYAELGHTGLTWDQMAASDGDDSSWHKQARRTLEAWWDPSKPFVVLDLDNDEMWLTADVLLAADDDG